MKEEKEIFKPKLRITTLSENGNPLSDRLVDACTEMYAGPKVQHKGPIRIEVTLVNQQDISQFKEYLDKLSGNLPIKESAEEDPLILKLKNWNPQEKISLLM